MTFRDPVVLLGLLALPLLVAAYVRHERRRPRLATPALIDAVTPRRPRWRRHLPVALQAVALAGLVVAFARPQTSEAVPVEQATVVVATDRSGSMLARDVAPDRLTAARRAAASFMDAVPRDVRVGAVAFNHLPSVLAAPTRDHDAVRRALTAVRSAGSTATGDALASALALIRGTRRPGASRNPPAAIVLLSDGESVRGRDALEVAREARAARVRVYTVALGTASGTIPREGGGSQAVPPDPETMRAIARTTGGRAFATDDADQLAAVYDQLGSELATEQRDVERTSWFAGGALALLGLGVIGSVRWFGRLV